jgi:hypothetical protein
MKKYPAFPVTPQYENNTNVTFSGLTIQQHFSLEIMKGLISANYLAKSDVKDYPKVAVYFANLLIKELENEEGR